MIRNYFSIHHRFLAWIGQLTNLVVISPHPTAIGNASEDYYFGLLKARYEAKKLLVLFPYPILRQPSFAPALLFLQSDFLAIRFGGPVSIILYCIWTAYFLCLSFVKPMLAFICRIQLSGYYWRPLVGQDILWRPAPEIIKFDWELLKKQEFSKQLSIPIELSLPKKKNEYCVA